MTKFRRLALLLLAATIVPALPAKTRCPGNAASVPLRYQHSQMFVEVSVNHSGPYQFLLDTGTLTTTIESSLAAELGLKLLGVETVVGPGFQGGASSAHLDLLSTGSKSVTDQNVLVYSLERLQPGGLNIRGILGADFLSRFDLLIDNAHRQICLDDSPVMRESVRGQRIDLATSGRSLILVSLLSGSEKPVRLWLDSGTNVPFLYHASAYLTAQFSHRETRPGIAADGAEQEFVALAPHDVKISTFDLSRVSFFTFSTIHPDFDKMGFDGLLPTSLFRRIFISYADGFVVPEPR
jgi:hypothetical protein